MQRVGTTILWTIADTVHTTAAVLQANGFEGWTPRNNYSESLNKAIKAVSRDWDLRTFGANVPKRVQNMKHQRFKDDNFEARIAYTVPRVDGDNFHVDTAMVIILTYETGTLSFERKDIGEGSYEELKEKLKASYLVERDRVNADEFRRFVGRYAQGMTGCNGIPLRPAGGAYFVPGVFDDRLAKLKNVFTATQGGEARLITVPMYDDEETNATLEAATKEAFQKEFETLQAEIAEKGKAGMTRRVFDGYTERLEALRQRMNAFVWQLRTHATTFEATANKMSAAMDTVTSDAADKIMVPFDFLAEMDKL